MVDTLLFDLGGVVLGVDFDRVFQAWADSSRVPAAHIAERFAFDERYEEHERGEIEAHQYCAHLRHALGLSIGDDELIAGWNRLFVSPVPEMPALLEQLARSYPLHVFSNTNRAHTQYWRRNFGGLLAPFTAIHLSCEIGARKPEQAAFAEVARRIGAAPEAIAFFDDSAVNVEGARNAGLLAEEVHGAADVRAALVRFGVRLDGRR